MSQYLYGTNTVLSALTANKRILYNLYLSEPAHEKHEIISKANALNLKITMLPKEKLENLANNKPHQGVILKASEIRPHLLEDPREMLLGTNQLWLCLDQINDPQNLGGILRTAQYFSVNGVLLPQTHTAPLSPAVAKVSSGALEWLNICEVNDFPSFLASSKKLGWKIVGMGQGKNINEMGTSDNTILVVGNEGSGIRDRVKKQCHDLFWIPGGGETIDSLNVGAAVSIFLHKIKHG